MLEWHEYVGQLLQKETVFDGISLSLDGNSSGIGVPPIVKASILLLDKIVQNQGPYNIIVFPERRQSVFIFSMMMLLHSIDCGKIGETYDPADFQPGEKLKLSNAVVEFVGLEERNGKTCIKIKLADLTSSAPIDFFPLFQRVSTQRRLSPYTKFIQAKKKAENQITGTSHNKRILKTLADYKTHMDSSIFYMTSIIQAKESIADSLICGKRFTDLLLIGQADYNGTISNIGAGQLAGTPPIVLAPDLYAVVAAYENNHPVQSVIIGAPDSSRLLTQLDALDDLMRAGFPITYATDTVNSFDLPPFKSRGFNIWRWDETSITPKMYHITSLSMEKKIRNCHNRTVEYVVVDGYEINDVIRRLVSHRNEFKEQSLHMMQMYDNLTSLAFAALRMTVPFSTSEISRANLLLDKSMKILCSEESFMASALFEDFSEIVRSMKKLYSPGDQLQKNKILSELLLTEEYDFVCIVVPERTDKDHVQAYWQRWCLQNGLRTVINVLYPEEYCSASCSAFTATVIVGWLKRAVMKKILFSFITQKYVVLLYDCESRWKDCAIAKWVLALSCSDNKKITNCSLSNEQHSISTRLIVDRTTPVTVGIPDTDELNEIEFILRENKYRQYGVSTSTKPGEATAEAIPVNFVGGYLAFYRTGHKVISVTEVIKRDAEKIDLVSPDELCIGDFVVVREADRDLIRDMADIILSNSGKIGLRELATRWKEALEIERERLSPEEIHQKLINAGCTKGYATVRSWLMDDDVIAPQQKQDLQYISSIAENNVLSGLVDQIYDAAQEVRAAHVHAGRLLSALLRSRIVEVLHSFADLDPYNIWEPIEITVEGIGPVKILKIIDIGQPIVVDIANTNRLIEE